MAQFSKGLIPRPKEFVAVLFCYVKNIVGFVATKALIGDNATFDSVSLGWYSNAFVADNDGATYTN